MKIVKGTKIDQAEPRRTLPSFTLSSSDLPELKDWDVGGVYFLKIKVEQITLGKGDQEWGEPKKGDKKRHARYQVLGIEALGEKESFESEYARKRERANK